MFRLAADGDVLIHRKTFAAILNNQSFSKCGRRRRKSHLSRKKNRVIFGRLPATTSCGFGQSPFCCRRPYFVAELLIRPCDSRAK
jgi:hypothetical protein